MLRPEKVFLTLSLFTVFCGKGFLALDFHSGTILQAKEECGINGLPSGAKISEFYRLAQVIKEGNISKLWLGIKRHLFPPTWVSEESPKEKPLLNNSRHLIPNRCYALNSRLQILEEMNCDKHNAYICQGLECERCFKTSTTCLHHNGKCFQIFNRKVTWYRARQLCKAQTREGDLAVTKEVTFVKRLSRKAHRHLSGEVRLFWVGKRTTDYEADKALEYYSWSENQPNTANQWVMMVEVNGMYLWSTANSSYSAHYFCESNPEFTSEAMLTTATSGQKENYTEQSFQSVDPTLLVLMQTHNPDAENSSKIVKLSLVVLLAMLGLICVSFLTHLAFIKGRLKCRKYMQQRDKKGYAEVNPVYRKI